LEEYQDDVKKGKPKWLLWLVIGVAAIIVIVVMATQFGGKPSSASQPTIDELSASIQGLQTWKAAASEDLANLNSKQQQILSQLSGITTPKDWTQDMNNLKDEVKQTIDEAVAGINTTLPRYAMVSMMTKYEGTKLQWYGDVFTNVEVHGQGAYPVVVTFYGSGLNNATLYWPSGSGYDVCTSFVFNYNCNVGATDVHVGNESISCVPEAVELIAFVVPHTGWGSRDLIQLGLDPGLGSVSYVTAAVGGTWLTPVTPAPGEWPI
jgi:hypothetical protein